MSRIWRGRPPVRPLWPYSAPRSPVRPYTTAPTAPSPDPSTKSLILRLPHCSVYRYGEAPPKPPLFSDVDWSIREGEAWAVVGTASGGKADLLEVLLGHHRILPPPPDGPFPFLLHLPPARQDAPHSIAHVSFATRPKSLGGGFYDYSARYGAVREEDRLTLKESLVREAERAGAGVGEREVKEMAGKLDLERLLELPLVALSNGQTRRASVLRKLLTRPELLLLDEPLTGLDPQHRASLLSLLQALHAQRSPRILLALRPQDPLPSWITHVCLVSAPHVRTGPATEFREELERHHVRAVAAGVSEEEVRRRRREGGEVLVDMQGVNIAYHERKVLKDITWTIRAGEQWHLQGANGSGKTTLLSVLTGDHPQSYVQRHLQLFGKPRRKHATIALQQNIGFVSPELYNAFPRRLGAGALSGRDAVGTGFECTFSYRPRTAAQEAVIDGLVQALAPPSWADGDVLSRPFAALNPGEQTLCLLMRALVNKPPLLALDEVFSGMDDEMVARARAFLREYVREGGQAVVWVSHWEEEMPWEWEKGEVRRIRLQDGAAVIS
ncbi:P-loop containing nucleoside triphosphate hydrolase protein [Calocera cornea HHB12733]|uniref:p-loop containing nucleoside triphosphate hydrolase protein n=1 Tax=Calocera cornea HHB12733 TaxID=1353952 RepID=A0A165EWS5_9BASI|nr:P-loop containing nucleoside triphosphate hydrolase protein [Calocera cornea HHB12733]